MHLVTLDIPKANNAAKTRLLYSLSYSSRRGSTHTPIHRLALLPCTWPSQCILGKGPRKCLLAADFLAANKRVDCDGNSPVDILGRAVLRQAHLAEGLADSHDGF